MSSSVRGLADGFLFRRPLLGRGSLGRKKWSRSPLLMVTGFEGSGREENLGVFLGATSPKPHVFFLFFLFFFFIIL